MYIRSNHSNNPLPSSVRKVRGKHPHQSGNKNRGSSIIQKRLAVFKGCRINSTSTTTLYPERRSQLGSSSVKCTFLTHQLNSNQKMSKNMKSLDHHTSKGIGGSLSENDAEDVDAVFKQSKKTYLNGKQRRIHKIIKHNRSRPYLAPTRKRASDNNKKREQGSSEARGISDNEMDESNTISSLLLAPWAPRNTNQFLCQDMEARVNKDNEAEQGTNSYRTRCFSLNVVNVSSSSLDDSTSEETMSDSEYNDTYEFDREYEEVCKDRLEALSKAEVTQEFIAMERKQMTLNEDVDNLVEENHLLKQLLNKNGISFSEVVAAEKRHTRSHSHSSDSASYVSESNDMEELENLLVESNTSTTSDTPLSKSQVAV